MGSRDLPRLLDKSTRRGAQISSKTLNLIAVICGMIAQLMNGTPLRRPSTQWRWCTARRMTIFLTGGWGRATVWWKILSLWWKRLLVSSTWVTDMLERMSRFRWKQFGAVWPILLQYLHTTGCESSFWIAAIGTNARWRLGKSSRYLAILAAKPTSLSSGLKSREPAERRSWGRRLRT